MIIVLDKSGVMYTYPPVQEGATSSQQPTCKVSNITLRNPLSHAWRTEMHNATRIQGTELRYSINE